MRSPRLALSLILAATAIGGCAVLTERRASGREQAAETAFPPTGQLLQVEGTTVHAHVQGIGPDLVLIHGASGNTRDFTFALVDRLAQDYRVIAFDRPGLGWTEDLGDAGVSPLLQARLLQAAADKLGVTRPIVMGHSYGGAVAMAWGLTDTADVAALVVVSGATMPWPGGLGPFYAMTGTRIGGATVVPAITAFVSPERAEQVVDSVFAPAPPPPWLCGICGRRPEYAAPQFAGQRPAGLGVEALCHPYVDRIPKADPASGNSARNRRYDGSRRYSRHSFVETVAERRADAFAGCRAYAASQPS